MYLMALSSQGDRIFPGKFTRLQASPCLPRPRGPELQSSEPSGIQAQFAGCQTSAALRMNSGLANSICLLSLGGGRSDLAGPKGVQVEVREPLGKTF